MQRWLLGLMTVDNQATHQVDQNCEMFFNWSIIVSTIAHLRNRTLSAQGSSIGCIFKRCSVTSSTPHYSNRVRASGCERELLSPNSLPNKRLANAGAGLRSSTLPGISVKLSNSPRSLKSRCSLKPKNQPTEVLPRAAWSWNTRCC